MEVKQPPPTPNSRPAVWDLVVKDMQRRDQVKERYGTRLQTHNGRNSLQDAYEESLDLAVYLRQKIEEQRRPAIDTVFVDMDGVIVNFIGGALARHGAGTEKIIPGEWFAEKWLGITTEQFWEKLQGESFWVDLGWMHDGREILRAVNAWLLPYGKTPHLLTSPCWDVDSYSGKALWVAHNYPGLSRKLILCQSKWVVARTGALLIDDNDENCQKWQARGGDAILVPRPWNSGCAVADRALEFVTRGLEEIKERMVP